MKHKKIKKKTYKKNTEAEIQVNVYNFEKLVKLTITNAVKLIEYFRLNLIYYQLISGKGLEFDRLKEYAPGMDVHRIDWKVFSRTDKLFVRTYKEERKFDIVFFFDVSDSMLLGTTDMTKNEFANLVIGTFAFAAIEAGDNVAITMLSDKVEIVTDPEGDYFKLMRLMSNKEHYGGKKDWNNLSRILLNNYGQDAILFFVSDFIDSPIKKILPDLAAHFSKVYGIMIRDPIDVKLPENVGSMYLKNLEGKNYLSNLDKLKEEYEVLAKKEMRDVEELFHDYGQLFFKIITGEDFSIAFIKSLGHEQVIID